MAKLALPYRIGIVVALVLVGAYFTVLKPKDDKPAPVAPGVAGLKTSIDKANGAVAQSDAANANAAAGAATPAQPAPAAGAAPATPGATPSAPAAPKLSAKAALAAVAEGDASAKILRELVAGKTAVVLFSSPAASDDRYVRRMLGRIDRHHGNVAVHKVGIADIGRYEALTRGVQVTHAPTLLVIGQDLKARKIIGFTDRAEVNQLVNDVSGLRTTLRPSSYKALVQRGCATTTYNVIGDGKSLADRDMRVVAFRDDVQALSKRLRGATVPAKFGPFNAQYLRYLTDVDRTLARLTPRSPEQAYAAAVSSLHRLDNRINAQAAGTGLRCAA